MLRLPEKLWLLCALAAVAAGCKPKIGDDCQLPTDCSAAGDRECDITAPDGYCTVYNCEPDSCPVDESLCVQFGAQRSAAAKCIDQQAPSPYARAFCMATCDKDSDCRAGYTCEDLADKANPWTAVLIDRDRGNRACMVPISAAPVTDDSGVGGAFGDVCKSKLPPAKTDTPSTGGTATSPTDGAPDAMSGGGAAGLGGAG